MRKLAREVAFKMIFENLFRQSEEFNEDCFVVLKDDESLSEEDSAFSKCLFDAYIQNKQLLLNVVAPALNGYEISRAYKVDLALIMLAVAEIKFVGTDKKIVINEIVNMAKKFSTDKSPKFVNGVLATLVGGDGN